MNETEHHELRMSLGAYALGHLDDEERARVEAHLGGCAACTAELAEITPAVSALSHVRRPSRPSAPPPELAARVEDAVRSAAAGDRRRRLTRAAGIGGLAAAAVLAVVAGTVAIVREPSSPVPLEAVPVQVRDDGVRASADLIDHTWGVEVRLTGSGFASGRGYRVAVIGTDGSRYPAGGFVGTGAASMVCNLNSSVLRDRASGFEVADRQGHVVVSSTFG